MASKGHFGKYSIMEYDQIKLNRYVYFRTGNQIITTEKFM